MRIRFLAPAAKELDEAVEWYANQAQGLAGQFLDEIETVAKLIVEHPDAWHPIGNDIRRIRLARFPYGLLYTIEANEIIVLAVAHLHREPTYWRDRL